MALSASSVLHYWSARYGPIPIVGGKPVHTRNSAARWVDQQGVLQSAIVNTPRFEWATIASERRQVMRLEQARTGGWDKTEELDDAAWTKVGATITANATAAPDGTATMDKIVETAAVGSSHGVSRLPTMTDNTKQSFSCRVLAAERTFAAIWTRNKAGGDNYTFINLSTGAITRQDAGHTNVVVRALVGGGWELPLTFDSSAGASAPHIRVLCATGDGSSGTHVAYDGDTTKGIYAWGLHFEPDKASSSSYIKDAASRSADQFYWNYPPTPQAMMIYARFIERGTVLIANSGLLSITDATESSVPFLRVMETSGKYRVQHWNGTTQSIASLAAAPTFGQTCELLAVLYSDGHVELVQSINEAAVSSATDATTVTLGSTWAATRLYLNNRGETAFAGQADFGEIKIVKYADVVGVTAQARMDELRAFELNGSGEVIS